MTTDDPGLSDDTPVVAALEPFDAFYRREYRPVLGLASVLCGNVTAAEDLTQDAFILIMRDWERVGRMDNPGGWVRRIVANRSISRFRRGVAEIKAIARLGSDEIADTGLGAEITLDTWREVRRLPRRQAQVVALTYLLDLSRRQIAETLDCSEETVKTHLERARRRLALRLSDYGEAR